MIDKYTISSLKSNNKKVILNNIYSNKSGTQLGIVNMLGMSRPTVAQILKELEAENLIIKEGLAASTGGRKANILTFNGHYKISIGVELRANHFELAAIDLYANVIKLETFFVPFTNNKKYFDELCKSISQFADSTGYPDDKILGIGIGLQALISTDGEKIIYGKILNCTGLTLSEFTDRLPYKCTFNHDAESLANSELWMDKSLTNAIFFNIRDNLSGTVIMNRSFFRGSELKSGVFEHMTLVENGKKCYCGKRGCVNAYCSFSALLNPYEDIDTFFIGLRNKDTSHKKRWDEYLSYLAMTIDNLHMIITSDVILGGKIANYLTQSDLDILHQKLSKRSAFPIGGEYVRISKSANRPLCAGAAIPLVQKYLQTLM